MKTKLVLLRNVFLIIFILSTAWIYISYITLQGGGPNGSSVDLSVIAAYVSIYTSIATFLGFVATTILSFRREKRESREAVLSQELKEIELERARLELEQLKKQVNKKKK